MGWRVEILGGWVDLRVNEERAFKAPSKRYLCKFVCNKQGLPDENRHVVVVLAFGGMTKHFQESVQDLEYAQINVGIRDMV